jgi:hypothetical protein
VEYRDYQRQTLRPKQNPMCNNALFVAGACCHVEAGQTRGRFNDNSAPKLSAPGALAAAMLLIAEIGSRL